MMRQLRKLSSMTTPACTVAKVSKSFSAPRSTAKSKGATKDQAPEHHSGKVHAVHEASLQIAPGEIVALLGPNGAGKTTLIDMVLGLTQPSKGEIRVFGKNPNTAVKESLLGAVLQTGGLLPDITVIDTVRMVASAFPNPRNIDEVLEETNLTSIAKRRVKRCSGGEQQRLKHALAILGSPDLLILDEPTSGMDPNARRNFWTSMEAQAERKTTIIFATHYLEEAQNFAQRIVLMNTGQIIADGTVDAIRQRATATKVSAVLPQDFDHKQVTVPVSHVEQHGERTTYLTQDSDALARFLLTETSARELTVTRASLDDAFSALTTQ